MNVSVVFGNNECCCEKVGFKVCISSNEIADANTAITAKNVVSQSTFASLCVVPSAIAVAYDFFVVVFRRIIRSILIGVLRHVVVFFGSQSLAPKRTLTVNGIY